MTLAQINNFCSRIHKQNHTQFKELAVANWLGSRADQEAFDKALNNGN